jgi:hypothetical protein
MERGKDGTLRLVSCTMGLIGFTFEFAHPIYEFGDVTHIRDHFFFLRAITKTNL